MLLIGLTGSIATGKSTVSNLLSQPPYSLPIIDADLLARQVVEPGTRGYNAIVKHFAPTTPDLLHPAEPEHPNTTDAASPAAARRGRPLNRPVLGRRVFGSTPSRTRDRAVLNRIVHPAVRWAMLQEVLRCYIRGHWAVVLDIPLLFESKLDVFCGVVIVVGVRDPEVQLRRLMARDSHLSEEDARLRVGSQGNVEGKVGRCAARGKGWGWVVWNDGGKEELKGGLREVMREVEGESPRWWGWVLLGFPPLAAVNGAWSMFWGWLARRKWETGGVGKENMEDVRQGRERAKL